MSLANTETSNGATARPVEQVPLAEIVRSPFNRNIDTKSTEFKDFVGTIRKHGVIQPILLRPLPAALDMATRGKGVPRYELVYGERRWLGAQAAELTAVPATVRVLSDREAIEIQTLENDQREDLSPIEQAEKYQQLLDIYLKEGMNQEKAMAELCAKLSKGKSTVYEALRLLKLPAEAKEAVKSGLLPPSHAGLIAKLEDAPEVQAGLVKIVLEKPKTEYSWQRTREEGGILSFRDTKELVDDQVKLSAARKKWEAAAAAHRAKGGVVLAEADHVKHFGQYGNIKGGYVGGHELNSDYSKNFQRQTYKALMGKHAPKPTLAHDTEYKVIELYPKQEALAAIEKAGHKKRKPQSGGGYDAGAYARQEQKKNDFAARMAPVEAAAEKEILSRSKKPGTKFPWAYVVSLIGLRHEEAKVILERHGWKQTGKGYDAALDTIIGKIGQLPANAIPDLVVEILVANCPGWDRWSMKFNPKCEQLCKHYGVNLAKLKKELAPEPPKAEKKKVQTPGTAGAKAKPDKTNRTKKTDKKGLTAATRKKLADAMKARWAARRKAAKK